MIRYLAPLPASPGGRVAEVYAQLRRDFGTLAEPITLHTAVPELLATAWATLRETVIADGRLPRRIKEAMALAISAANHCPYCIDAHGIVLHALGDGGVETALRRRPEDRQALETLGDPRLAAFTAWAAASGAAAQAAALPAPFTPPEAPEALGTVLCFQYVNRMVTVLLDASPLPAAPLRRAVPGLGRPVLALAGRRFAGAARAAHPPGESLSLVSPAAPQDFHAWAAAAPPIQTAFAAFAAAAEGAAAAVLEPTTRRQLRRQMAGWQGEPARLGTAWLNDALAQVNAVQQPAARLALLAARAPERLGAVEITDFRRRWPADAALVAVLAWGSHEAARRIAAWLTPAA